MVDRLLHSEKAPLPMDVTISGILIEVKPTQSKKALSPIFVTVFGMTVFEHPLIKVFELVSIIALQLLRESYFELPLATVIEVKLLLGKAPTPMLVTLWGMLIKERAQP